LETLQLGLILLNLPLLLFADLVLFLKLIPNYRSTDGTQASADSRIKRGLLEVGGYICEALSKSYDGLPRFRNSGNVEMSNHRLVYKTIRDKRCIRIKTRDSIEGLKISRLFSNIAFMLGCSDNLTAVH